MKKTMVFALLAVALLVGVATAGSVGVGAYGGVGIPVLQDDTGRGTNFGIRVPVSLIPLITVEPYFLKSSGSDKSQDIGGITITRTGIDVTGFGANAMLTLGGPLQFYPFVGIGSHKLSRVGSADETRTAYNFGFGIGIKPPVAKLSIHLRAEVSADVQGATSRKWAGGTVGVSYELLKFPPTP